MEGFGFMSFDPADHTIEEVHEHLAAHPEDTEAVLAAEQARGDDARVTLVNSLSTGSTSAEQQPVDSGEPAEKFDDGVPAGEYPSEGVFGYESDKPGVQAGE